MLRARAIVAVLLGAAMAGCQTTTVPERREILGSWASEDFAGGVIEMTVAETAREVTGAGFWLTDEEAHPFEVVGAIAVDEVGLLFDVTDRLDLVFQGYFEDEDTMIGTISGDGFRLEPIVFIRQDFVPD